MRLSLWTLATLLSLSIASPVPTTSIAEGHLSRRKTPLNAFLTVLLDYFPALDGTLESVVGVLPDFESLMAKLTGEPTTYNDLGSTTCKPYTVVFARGTSEPGNVGILVGPPFFDALIGKVGAAKLAIQGVNHYSASIAGYLAGGDLAGGISMAAEIQKAMTLCPSTKLVVSGYSQGCQLVHNAVRMLDSATAAFISKVVLFGDPDDGKALPNVDASKVKTYCSAEDDICINGDLILPAHLLYGEDAEAAAAFVVS